MHRGGTECRGDTESLHTGTAVPDCFAQLLPAGLAAHDAVRVAKLAPTARRAQLSSAEARGSIWSNLVAMQRLRCHSIQLTAAMCAPFATQY